MSRACRVAPGVPVNFYGSDDPQVDELELGRRAAFAYDDASKIEHRLARANGLEYGCPPRHWQWERDAIDTHPGMG